MKAYRKKTQAIIPGAWLHKALSASGREVLNTVRLPDFFAHGSSCTVAKRTPTEAWQEAHRVAHARRHSRALEGL